MAVSLFKISTILVELLREHNRVSLPGIGAFKTEYKPATLIKNGKSLLPPSKVIEFREEELWNDGLLEARVAAKECIPLDEAKQQITQLTTDIQTALDEGKRVELPDFGTLRITADGDYLFEKDDDLNLLPESIGLDELSITPLSEVSTNPITIQNPEPVSGAPIIKPIISTINKEEPEDMESSKTNRYIIIVVAIILLAAAGFALYMVYNHYRSQSSETIVQTTPEDDYPQAPVVDTTPQQAATVYTPPEVKKPARHSGAKRQYYHVILGAYSDEATAESVMIEQKNAGVCDRCEIIRSGGQYKISAYRYKSRREATEMLDGFKRTDVEYLNAWVERF
ncbi:MAG: SPOR domain-containing protein [Prevotellaceae bacterium]|jgi:nucleoid DNA-binding protein|nr:SPOR domain-containing protein [Prevotellaceae bacterium]